MRTGALACLLTLLLGCNAHTIDRATPDGGAPGAGPGSGAPRDVGPGPWPLDDLVLYGPAAGLDQPLIDATPDDGQNIWAASHERLYLLRPHASGFVAYTAAHGLHIGPFVAPDGAPAATVLTAIAGGAAGQVFVGYYGYESDD